MNKKNLLHLAKLSKLKTTNLENNKYTSQLEETITYIKNLNKLDTKKIKPSHHVLPVNNVFFEDGVKNNRILSSQDLKQTTKLSSNKFFITNKVLEK
jgi:aspartyl/glutamyl-tRNA(Asn/Gln) amidotransferase C subunit